MISRDAAAILADILGGATPDAARYRDAIAGRHRIAAAWSHLMARYPLILGPVSTMEAFPVGYDTGGPEVLRRLIRSFRLTELCNLLGLPSVAVPVGLTDGATGVLPQGVQIIGRRFDEDRCLDAAEVIEARCGVLTPIEPRSE
jgi:amidase